MSEQEILVKTGDHHLLFDQWGQVLIDKKKVLWFTASKREVPFSQITSVEVKAESYYDTGGVGVASHTPVIGVMYFLWVIPVLGKHIKTYLTGVYYLESMATKAPEVVAAKVAEAEKRGSVVADAINKMLGVRPSELGARNRHVQKREGNRN